ncbi:MAG: calcium/sodium antiporter [Bacteroidetes bacterium]|nr:calcium/sodium antiporter [Bacteroidota bacterium]
MFLNILLLVVGFVILIAGADYLVSGSSSIAKKFGVSNLAIGLTVVAFGTSMPELLVSVQSSFKGFNDAAFGNVIGSNNFNLLFILGIAGIIYPLVVQRNTVKYEVPLSLLAAGVLFLLVNDSLLFGAASFSVTSSAGTTTTYNGILSRLDSVILLLFFAGFLMYIYRSMKTASDYGEDNSIKIYKTPIALLMTVGGLVGLVFGADLVVKNAVELAERFHMSQKLIGLTILAAGTSLPELATSCVAAYKKNTDIAIGNVVGSNIFNIFFILGVTGLINPVPYNTAMNFDLYILMGSTVLLMIFMFTLNTRKLDRWEAALMLAGYIVYTVMLIGIDNGSVKL